MTDEDADALSWKTLDSEVSYTCEGFDIVTDDVRFPDGSEGEFDYMAEGESVVILPFTEADDVVVIEEWRQAVERLNRAIPAGQMEDEDDDPVATARRELTEETGYVAGSMEHLTTVEPMNGSADAVFHYFVARDCVDAGEQGLDDNEWISVETTAFDALLDAARDDELRDGRSMTAIVYYELFGEE